ncbi:MAG: macro domain-containing protein [Coriobacteriia bacterium]|nr:macro domain-containing protein [Coriobacteriia bacterium]
MAFTIIREDLARVQADAIVVPANKYLEISGGTGLTVAEAAGLRRVRRACKRLGGCPVGDAVATPAFKLPAKHIIHAVGPIWQGGDNGEAQLLRSAYDSALNLALRLNSRSVALPLLSAGTFGYPMREAFEIAVEAIRAFLDAADPDMDVILVLYDKRAVIEGSRMFGEIAEYIDDAYADSHVGPNMSRRRRMEVERPWSSYSYRGGFDAEEEAIPDVGPGDTGSIVLSMGVDTATVEEPYESAGQLAGAGFQVGYCRHCGASYKPGAAFCMQCGHPLDGREVSASEARRLEELAAIPEPWSASEAPVAASYSMSAPESAPTPRAPKAAPLPKGRRHFGAPSVAPRRAERESAAAPTLTAECPPSLGDMLARMDAPFSMMLMQLIDARGLTDAQVYKRANISRQHFSKMRNPGYRPTKKTVIALAIALELPLEDMRELLARAGFALTHSDKSDIIVEYFVSHGNYDMFAINEALFAYDQPLLN